MIRFEKTLVPEISSPVIAWHIVNGWCYNVRYIREGQAADSGNVLAVFYCTILGGHGAMLHFVTVPGKPITPAFAITAMRKGIRMVAPHCDLLLAPVPYSNPLLLAICRKLGFFPVSEFTGDEEPYALLQYFADRKCYFNSRPPQCATTTANAEKERKNNGKEKNS